MVALIDIAGMRFGKLLVLRLAHRPFQRGHAKWECKCDCGKTTTTRGDLLRKGSATSCGCLRLQRCKEASSLANRTHGMSKTRIFELWTSMLQRCGNSNYHSFHNYGGRGIRVCPRWMKFEAFYEDFGNTDPGPEYTMDRMDNEGDYAPGNVRWATVKQQNNNKRNTRRALLGTEVMTYGEIATKLGVTISFVRHQVDMGRLAKAIKRVSE